MGSRTFSSGRSFKVLLSRCRELPTKPFQAAANARVDAHRAGLQNDAADQLRIDVAGRVDRTAGRLLDLGDDLLRLVVRELVGRCQFHTQPTLLLRHQPFELALNLSDLSA